MERLVMEWHEVRPGPKHLSLALLTVAAAGTAGCVSQPWQLPDPYGYGSGSGAYSTYYPYGSGAYGYGSRYGSYPYYYSYRQGSPYYPGYTYYPGYYYCRDADRNGRCDKRHDRDDDHDHGDRDDDGGKGHDGSPPRLGERPFKEVRRYFRQAEPSGSSPTSTSSNPAVVIPAPAARGGGAPELRPAPRAPVSSSAPARVEPRRDRTEATAPARRGPRSDDAAPKGPRADDPASSRRPLR